MEVLYRKYRPSNFKEILGQDHIVRAISSSINLGNIAHAYLFSGSRGTGKTSVARILARELETSPNDLYEIDAASNNSVEEIRSLKENIETLPFDSKYKIYILDEVHMLSKSAFNAFLKVLEEPPKHIIFILATTEPQKIPETIISRCQTFNFKTPNQSVLREMVLDVAKKEGFTIENSSAELIAILADGAFRDAYGILQKVIYSSKDKKITQKQVEDITGASPALMVNKFIDSLDKKDTTNSLEILNILLEENIDPSVFLKLVLHKIRKIILMRFSKELEKKVEEEFQIDDFKFMKNIALNKETNINSKLLDLLLQSSIKIKDSYIKTLPLELAVLDHYFN